MTGRIWILANQGEVGGGEVMLHHLATALRELGRGVGVVAPAHPAETADHLAADGFDVVRVGGP
ncbi:glycosyl transferase family 1, partial [Aquicoccus sp. SCR17]|nr:glycosyl transferase family 1 [Carideicomes alvinocaridis]